MTNGWISSAKALTERVDQSEDPAFYANARACNIIECEETKLRTGLITFGRKVDISDA